MSLGLALLIACDLGATIWASTTTRDADIAERRLRVDNAMNSRVAALKRQIELNLAALNPVLAAAAISSPSLHDFEVAVRASRSAEANLQALEWIPRVPHDQRETHEATTRGLGFPNYYQITQRDPPG